MTHDWDEFEPFLEWALSSGWHKGLDLDRIDNDSGYRPENCRWVTRRENTNNRRKTMMLVVDGIKAPVSNWAEKAGIPRATVKYWVYTHGYEYASMRVFDAIKNGYIPKNYSYGH